MNGLDGLDAWERLTLYICCEANKFSCKSHVPREAIINRLLRAYKVRRQTINNAFKRLLSQGFVVLHKTKGGNTYSLTPKGLQACNRLRQEIEE